MHLIVSRVKDAWRGGKVASMLFLDIQSVFPNTVWEQLIHNLRECRVSAVYMLLINLMLSNRRTKLKFNNYMSE